MAGIWCNRTHPLIRKVFQSISRVISITVLSLIICIDLCCPWFLLGDLCARAPAADFAWRPKLYFLPFILRARMHTVSYCGVPFFFLLFLTQLWPLYDCSLPFSGSVSLSLFLYCFHFLHVFPTLSSSELSWERWWSELQITEKYIRNTGQHKGKGERCCLVEWYHVWYFYRLVQVFCCCCCLVLCLNIICGQHATSVDLE